MNNPPISETDQIAILADRASMPRTVAPDIHSFMVIPCENRVQDLEEFLPRPVRKRGTVQLTELESFNRFVKQFATSGAQIFTTANADGANFCAVLNYHEPGKGGHPQWGDHRAFYACSNTVEWQRWRGSNNKAMNQVDFAAFIEDNLEDIHTPPGATMLEIALTLQAKQEVDFKAGVRLSNGDHQLKYTSETKGSAGGNGELEIPAEFVLGIAPFIGGPKFQVRARLRYRINDSKLTLRYELVRTHKVIEAAWSEMRASVQHATGIEPLIGSSPSEIID